MFVQVFSQTQLTKEAWLGAFLKIPFVKLFMKKVCGIFILCPSIHSFKFMNLPILYLLLPMKWFLLVRP